MDQPPFPIKTKIAAWWTIVIILLITAFTILNWDFTIYLPLAILSYIFPIFILKRKKWAWWLTIASLIVINFFAIGFLILTSLWILGGWNFEEEGKNSIIVFFIVVFPVLTPLILLLIDRKNFWKIAS